MTLLRYSITIKTEVQQKKYRIIFSLRSTFVYFSIKMRVNLPIAHILHFGPLPWVRTVIHVLKVIYAILVVLIDILSIVGDFPVFVCRELGYVRRKLCCEVLLVVRDFFRDFGRVTLPVRYVYW